MGMTEQEVYDKYKDKIKGISISGETSITAFGLYDEMSQTDHTEVEIKEIIDFYEREAFKDFIYKYRKVIKLDLREYIKNMTLEEVESASDLSYFKKQGFKGRDLLCVIFSDKDGLSEAGLYLILDLDEIDVDIKENYFIEFTDDTYISYDEDQRGDLNLYQDGHGIASDFEDDASYFEVKDFYNMWKKDQ